MFSSFLEFAQFVQSKVGSLGKVEPYSSEQCCVITNNLEVYDLAMEKCKPLQTFPISLLRFYVIAGPT